MPVYDELSDRTLSELKNRLEVRLSILLQYPSKDGFEMFWLQLYEYMLTYITYIKKYHPVKQLKVKVTLTDIKLLGDNDVTAAIIELKKLADNIRHNGYKSIEKSIYAIVKSSCCKPLKNYLPASVKDFLFSDTILSVYKELYYAESLRSEVDENVQPLIEGVNGTSLYTVSEIVKQAMEATGCSFGFALDVVYSYIKDGYFVN